MKANLKIEAIGYGGRDIDRMIGIPPRYWVALMIYDYKREFLKGKIDYSCSNSKASRGVYVNYIIESCNVYEVKSPTSWKSIDLYYATVDALGNIRRHGSWRDAKKTINAECTRRFY